MEKINKKINLTIYLILILTLFSSILIYFSTSNQMISQKYSFVNEIYINNFKKIEFSQKLIGNIEIENNGFIISKIYFKNLIGCINDRTIIINYYNSNKNNIDIFPNYNQNSFIEIQRNSKKNISIKIEGLFNIKNNTSNEILIYNKKNNYDYNFCVNTNNLKPIKIIKIITK